MLAFGIAFCGAVAVGAHHHDELGCVGPALVEAAKAEQASHAQPRITMCDSVPRELHTGSLLLLRGNDPRWIDFLRVLPREGARRETVLARLREMVDEQVRDAAERGNDAIRRKWDWLSEYVAEYEG